MGKGRKKESNCFLKSNLDPLWPRRPQCSHQALQGAPHSPSTMSVITCGVQQERHVQ